MQPRSSLWALLLLLLIVFSTSQAAAGQYGISPQDGDEITSIGDTQEMYEFERQTTPSEEPADCEDCGIQIGIGFLFAIFLPFFVIGFFVLVVIYTVFTYIQDSR